MDQSDQKDGAANSSPDHLARKRRPVLPAIFLCCWFLFLFLIILFTSSWVSAKNRASFQATATAEFQRGFNDGASTIIAEDTATASVCTISTATSASTVTAIRSCATMTPTP